MSSEYLNTTEEDGRKIKIHFFTIFSIRDGLILKLFIINVENCCLILLWKLRLKEQQLFELEILSNILNVYIATQKEIQSYTSNVVPNPYTYFCLRKQGKIF